MNRFAALLDRLSFEPSRNGKLRLLQEYFRSAPDPDRGYALAAIAGALRFTHARPALIRTLVCERVDPTLFAMSYDYVGDLSETAALLWPAPAHDAGGRTAPGLGAVVDALAGAKKADLPALLAGLLDRLDEHGRWALLKLITGGLRIGVSARLARTALAANAGRGVDDIEEIWPALTPPYAGLFAWIEGRGERPADASPLAFRPAMLAHPLDDGDLAGLDPSDFFAEWKWDGVRIQAATAAPEASGERRARLYTRRGEEIGAAFPDLVGALSRAGEDFIIDGELLALREGRAASFSDLQRRLNRKQVPARLLRELPGHIRVYDLLAADGRDWRAAPFEARRARLAELVAASGLNCISLSEEVAFAQWEDLALARARPQPAEPAEAGAIEGVMLKRRDAPYVAGRPKGLWHKWKRDPMLVDAVLMYAQRGHGRRASLFSDFTFGLWTAGADGDELTPVGKAYFGFTDAELKRLDSFVRANTLARYGPVCAVASGGGAGLVLEIAFEGVQRSPRRKAGLSMRFPRISRIRWDKPAAEADRLEALARFQT